MVLCSGLSYCLGVVQNLDFSYQVVEQIVRLVYIVVRLMCALQLLKLGQ